MRRLILRNFTGTYGDDEAIARRMARKIQASQRQGQCVLVDCEGVVMTKAFWTLLRSGAREDKVRFCGEGRAHREHLPRTGHEERGAS